MAIGLWLGFFPSSMSSPFCFEINVYGLWLHSMILKIFSNLNDSMILHRLVFLVMKYLMFAAYLDSFPMQGKRNMPTDLQKNTYFLVSTEALILHAGVSDCY